MVCDAVRRLAAPTPSPPEGELISYFRLTTRPIDQTPFEAARARLGDAVLRRQVLAGAYRLHDAGELAEHGAPAVNLAASGAILPEALAAAAMLADEGVAAHVVEITSPSRIYEAWRATIRTSVRTATIRSHPGALHGPFQPGAPVVTVHDASSHALAWLGTALGVPGVALGVDGFGQSGTIADLYELNDIDVGSIVNAALGTLT
jgi:pyruvate dehydrogenase E1 component